MDKLRTVNKVYIHIFIMLILMFGTRFLPGIGGITPLGMAVVGILFGMIYGWVTLSFGWPSCLAIVALATTDLYASGTELISASFGAQNTILFLAIFIMSAWLSESGLAAIITKTMLSLPFTKGRPWMTAFIFIVACYVVALLTSSVSAALIFLGLFRTFSKQAGIEPYNDVVAMLLIGIALACATSELGLPIKGCALIYLSNFTGITNITVDMGKYTLFMLPACIVLLGCFVLFCRFILKIDAGKMRDVDFSTKFEASVTRWDKWALASVAVFLFALMIPSFVPNMPGVSILLKLGSGGIGLLYIAALCMIHVQGKPLLDLGKTVPRVAWDMWFMTACFSPVSSALTNESTGISNALTSIITPITGNLSPYLIVIFFVFSAAAITQIANNVIIGIMYVSIIATIAPVLGDVNVTVLMLMVTFGAHFSCVLPSANMIIGMCYGEKEWVTSKSLFKVGLSSCIFLLVIVVTIIYLGGTMLF